MPSSSGRGHQWRKCRSPVNTIASPSSSAFSMIFSSRIAPPGWITAATPGGRRGFDAVFERIERVARGRAALGPARGLLRRDLARLDAVLLAGADADRLAVLHEHDRVRLHVPADAPRELEVAPLLRRGRDLGDDAPVVARRREVVRRPARGSRRRSGGRRAARCRARGASRMRVFLRFFCSASIDARRRSPARSRRRPAGPRPSRSTVAASIGRFERDDAAERGTLVALERALVRVARVVVDARRRTGSRA